MMIAKWWVGLLVVGVWSVLLLRPVPAAAAECQFVLGFATLKGLIDAAEGPDKVGTCLENQRFNPLNGDALQQTTGGLLVWRKADNWTAFTDGYRTWINGPYGLQARLNTEQFPWEVAGPTVRPASPTAAPTPPAFTGAWVLSDETDATTARRRISVTLGSSSYSSARGGKRAWLGVGCSLPAGSTPEWYVQIDWGQRVARKGPVQVTTPYSIGSRILLTEDWYLSTDGEETFAPKHRVYGPASMISMLQETDRFTASVVTAEGEKVTVTWEVAGLWEALRPAAVVCGAPGGGWKLFDHAQASTNKGFIGVGLLSSRYVPVDEGQQAQLGIRCDLQASGIPSWRVFIRWGQRVAREGPVQVTTRYGMAPAGRENWDLGVTKDHTYAPDNRVGELDGVISKILETDRFEVSVVTTEGKWLMATWDVVGLKRALRPVVVVCGEPDGLVGRWLTPTPVPPTATPAPPGFTGAWRLDDRRDASTGKGLISVGLVSSSYRPARWTRVASLDVRCTLPARGAPEWEVWIGWSQHVGRGETEPVTTRYGTGRAVTEDWGLRRNEYETYALDNRVRGPGGVISKLQETDRFEASVVTVEGKALTATWEVAGLREALRPVVAVCGEP